MKPLLKSTKENYNKGEKQGEDNLNYYFKIRFDLFDYKKLSSRKKFNFII